MAIVNSVEGATAKHPADAFQADFSRNISFRKFIEIVKNDIETRLTSDLFICLDRIDHWEAIDDDITSRLMLFSEARHCL